MTDKWYEVNCCINDVIFGCSYIQLRADNEREALEKYIEDLRKTLDKVNLDEILEHYDECIGEVEQ